MKAYADLSREEAGALYAELYATYTEYRSRGLSLDLSRGKPNAEQLDLSEQMLTLPLTRERCLMSSGLDCRNYGVLDGLPEMKQLFADLMGLRPESIIIGGNSSLQLMYDTLARAMLFGTPESPRPWCRESGLKWICVVPGYDRHFKITETLGFELISVPMREDGPDMDEVERLVRDPKVKGIWCVPKYSNPTGNTYSDEVVRRLASMICAAPDFRIMWDNAYAIHDLEEPGDALFDIMTLARQYGTEERIWYFASTSKVTFPGAGVAMMAAGPRNLEFIRRYMGVQTIGYDKLNQLRHLAFFGDADHVREHMRRLGRKIRVKFDIAEQTLAELSGLGVAEWTVPRGGYFISLDTLPGCAVRVYGLMREAGVTLTKVGSTFPYGQDPQDRNLRLAPTYPSDEELRLAMQILTVAVRLAALEKLFGPSIAHVGTGHRS